MTTYLTASVVDESAPLSLAELARACRAAEEEVRVWVVEGVLEPTGTSPDDWRFHGETLRRARRAARLMRDLELTAPAVALALDLMERIDTLEARLRRLG